MLQRSLNDGSWASVAENIEDMQIAYFGDFSSDGTANFSDPNDWTNNPNANWSKVRGIRIHVVARTRREDPDLKAKGIQLPSIQAVEDGPSHPDSSNPYETPYQRRRLFTSFIRIRNAGL
ncbi:MAG: PilW family protein [Deltaproteobacteria bacterium]|nr:PilW family protein [Deltaproteobacteria bacterium]